MQVTIGRLAPQGPPAKMFEGHLRFLCLACRELRATVNPRNNIAPCFCYGRNYNNIDLLMSLDYDFLAAVDLLKEWLWRHRAHRAPVR